MGHLFIYYSTVSQLLRLFREVKLSGVIPGRDEGLGGKVKIWLSLWVSVSYEFWNIQFSSINAAVF